MVLASTLVALTVGCGGSSAPKTSTSAPSGQNTVAVSVNSGPTSSYANGLFVSVTVCVPGSSTCQTIPDILVDTGSTGLRLLSSVVTISLPQQSGSNGPVAECLPFLSGYTWGPVQSADIKVGGESASAVPIQVLSDTAFPVPTGCTNFGLQSMNTLQTLGANGLLGVGLFAQDCGSACAQTGSSNPGLYYQCPKSCQVTAQTLTQQVQNPVAMFSSDNNGVIILLPAASSPEASLSGSLVFGIGTQSNNALGSATVYTVNNFGNFTTTYKGQSYPNSFIDSGSNGYFFLDSSVTGLPDCVTAIGFYCPTSTQNLSATNQGASGGSGTVSFSVGNAETFFSNQSDFVFGNLGGPGQDFDWGLPFFYGRNVFTAIEGKSTPGGTGPYWAY
jgi:predicted aspartyl protease